MDKYQICEHAIGQKSNAFSNGSGDRSSIPGQVIPRTKKWYLIPPCLTQEGKDQW